MAVPAFADHPFHVQTLGSQFLHQVFQAKLGHALAEPSPHDRQHDQLRLLLLCQGRRNLDRLLRRIREVGHQEKRALLSFALLRRAGDRHDRAWSILDHFLRDAPQEHVPDAAVAVGAHDDDFCTDLFRSFHDLLGRIALPNQLRHGDADGLDVGDVLFEPTGFFLLQLPDFVVNGLLPLLLGDPSRLVARPERFFHRFENR